LRLEPGQKSHFVLDNIVEREWDKADHDLPLVMGDEDIPNYAGFLTDYVSEPGEPITIRHRIEKVKGLNRGEMENYNSLGILQPPSSGVTTRGITMYEVRQEPLPGGAGYEWPIRRINKEFSIHTGTGTRDYRSADYLDIDKLQENVNLDRRMHGNGFRIRWQLPGHADKMVFQQYNPRCLMDSYQAGSGDNWKLETFNGYTYQAPPPDPAEEEDSQVFAKWGNNGGRNFFYMPGRDNPYTRNKVENETDLGFEKPFDPSVHFTPISYNVNDLRCAWDTPIMPRIDLDNKNAIGFFQDRVDYEEVTRPSSEKMILFGVPREPILSMMQFRHANLNYYLQGSAYQVGNSYASTQVGRYKTWGRVRRIDFQPNAGMDPKGQDSKFTFIVPTPFGNVNVRLFPWDTRNWNFGLGTVRSTNSEYNHQNVVLDQNYYLNQALFDGYFLSGDERTGTEQDVQSGNPRYVPYNAKSYASISSSASGALRHQTNAGKLLVNGAFNLNSTSVEAWISQLASLKKPGNSKTPFPRTFTFQQGSDPISGNPALTDEQIELLAEKLVEEVKLRGPFLSFSDFVNRRLSRMIFESKTVPLIEYNPDGSIKKEHAANKGDPNKPGKLTANNCSLSYLPKHAWPDESRDTVLGLRGPVQAAIAKIGFNAGGFSSSDLSLPTVPKARFQGNYANFNYFTGDFGIHAVSLQNVSRPRRAKPNVLNPNPNNWNDWIKYPQPWGSGVELVDRTVPDPNVLVRATQGHIDLGVEDQFGNPVRKTRTLIPSPPYSIPARENGVYKKWRVGDGVWESAQVRVAMESYTNAFEYGEAPDAVLAVENVATGVNLPGWLTQADVLAPLAPVLTARSDTFTIRVMGESPASEENQIASRSWIEVTVQRVPEYVKASLDAPHHRPHEPFEDRNFDGIWNDSDEYWLDLNQNSRESIGGKLQDITNGIEAGPDLPGIGNTGARSLFAVGLFGDHEGGDVALNEDKHEEVLSTGKGISRKGINQRFGRKFKIIKFRWLRENEV